MAGDVLDYDAILFDAGGVLVLPDPTVLAPLLAPYGGDDSIAAHRRAHYAAMAVKSRSMATETDWDAYDVTYVESIGVRDDLIAHAAEVLNHSRTPHLWRWPIPESLTALGALVDRRVPIGVVSNASGQVEHALALAGVCQVGAGSGVPVRIVIDSHVVGVAKPDPRIFEFALEHFDGIDRSRILYVGDSVRMDVEGARAAGLTPVLLDPYGDHAEAEVARITSLIALV
jgi:putative hydrolase of the HAD superfamily